VYSGGIFDFKHGFAYVVFLTNVSQTVAIYCLIYIYLALKEELARYNPLGKFLCIKAVVFFSFWQTCFFEALVAFDVVQPALDYTAAQICAALSDFCLIFEMLVYTALHMYVFGFDQYRLIQAQGLWKTPWLRSSAEEDQESAGSIYRGGAYSKRNMVVNALRQDDVAQDVWRHTPGIRKLGHDEAVQEENPSAATPPEPSSASPEDMEAPLMTGTAR